MIIKHSDKLIRYTGRWNIAENAAVSTANGSYFEIAFKGESILLEFDTAGLRVPFPHLYIGVDGKAAAEVSLDKYIRAAAGDGEHRLCVIMKSSVENQQRWLAPMEARVSFVSAEAEELLPLEEDKRPIIEFIGDSITEGISIDTGYVNYGGNNDMVYWDDSTAGYAWRTAELLNMRPIIMGYGCLGTTRGGAGDVPPAAQSYPYYSDGCPMPSSGAEYIVINHGTNDRGAETEVFKRCYFELLELVRQRNPKAKIISLTPFSGCLAEEIKETVDRFNSEKADSVFYISTVGWIEPEPLHPTREGHRTVSKNLAEAITKKYLSI